MNTQDPNGNVTLLISNQSFDDTPVDITVSVDGHVAVDDLFDVEGDQLPQHNWRQYHLQLQDGEHTLTAEAGKGKTRFRTKVEVAGQQTITIAYWHDRRSATGNPIGYFTFESGPRPVATM